MIYERLYFEDMKTMLNRKDWRTIKRWCLKNGVSLFKDIGSNRWFAIKNEGQNQVEFIKWQRDLRDL